MSGAWKSASVRPAAGLLAHTRRIQIFSTFHVPVGHPVLAAKMGAAADHISGGRRGLDIVAGWHTAEPAMFGLPEREHDERYEVAAEWAMLLVTRRRARSAQSFR
jgi:dimethylsulfone monooxygenase